jgi:hypothetical protein
MAKEGSTTKTKKIYVIGSTSPEDAAKILKAAGKKPMRKPRSTVDVLADQTTAKKRSAAAKRADPAPAKVVVKGPLKRVDMIPTHQVQTIGQLRNVLATFPHASKFNTDRKFGVEIINVMNIRGRKVAEIHRAVIAKVKTK